MHTRHTAPIVVANWKMNGSLNLLRNFSTGVSSRINPRAELILCPPDVLIYPALSHANGHFKVGAQDCHWEKNGAFTGEVSPQMLQDAGVSHVIIGHSERRTLMGETNEYVLSKTCAAVDAGLIPIVCIGESRAQYDASETYGVLSTQLFECLPSVPLTGAVMIAYEPIWAIGSGMIPTLEEIHHVHDHIRTYVAAYWSLEIAEGLPILYGGSVKPDNAKEILALDEVDGLLIGGASLDPAAMVKIIEACPE